MGVIRSTLERYTKFNWDTLGGTIEDIGGTLRNYLEVGRGYLQVGRDYLDSYTDRMEDFATKRIVDGLVARSLKNNHIIQRYGIDQDPEIGITQLKTDVESFCYDSGPKRLIRKALRTDILVSGLSILQLLTPLGKHLAPTSLIELIETYFRSDLAGDMEIYAPGVVVGEGIVDRLADLGTLFATMKKRKDGQRVGIADYIRIGAEFPDIGFRSQSILANSVLYRRFLHTVDVEEEKGKKEEKKVSAQTVLDAIKSLGNLAANPAPA